MSSKSLSVLFEEILASHVAVLGKTGSGKTSTAKLAVEHAVADGERVCVLDPIKSDWWGITSSVDGRRPGLPFQILGGPHGHVPLNSSAGKVIGNLVAEGSLPHSIIDMADFEAGGLQRFFVDFAQALWRNVRGVVYLVIEEAHEFAPKERAGFGQENLAIHWAKKLATGSRTKGIRLIVATHRIQSLHNAVLGSCETMIAHRILAPADQEPVIKWLRANLKDKALRTEVEGSLSSLPTGTGWVCSGEALIFERIAFPRIATFDNTATPTRDGRAVEVATAPVNVAELRKLIGNAVADAEANDPIALKVKIAELQRQLAERPVPVPAEPDPAIADAAHAEGYARGRSAALAPFAEVCRRIAPIIAALTTHAQAVEDSAGVLQKVEHDITALARETGRETAAPPPSLARPSPPMVPRQAPPAPAPTPRPVAREANGSKLGKGPQAILDAVAWWTFNGTDTPTLAQVGFMAGYSHKSGTFDDYRSRLNAAGLIQYPENGRMRLTEQGERLAVKPTRYSTVNEFHERVRGRLTGPLQKFFDALIGRKTLTLEQLGEAAGYSSASGTFDDYRSRLHSLEIIVYPERGKVRIADWLWESARV